MIRVLVQAEAGSAEKVRYDEKTLEAIEVGRVSRPYPYAYGFVVATTAADGDNVDCYILGDENLKSGSIVDCEVVGLLEQFESGEQDHKVLAVVAGEKPELPVGVFEILENFIYAVFAEYPECNVRVGSIHSRDVALRYVVESRD